MSVASSIERLCVDTLRGLAMDAVQRANSGHPGLPMGATEVAHVLWTRHLRHNPRNPHWFDRDRFVLSAGHGSMLLYSLLFATGYGLTIEDLQEFRQWGSRTPGHPENELTPGVEMATGPLGQGFATAVGMAIAERFLAATFNRPGHDVVDHRTYALCSDGDLMEGVCQEAASLAGHLGLGKLIALYDDNRVTIDGSTELTFTEDTAAKFVALGWDVQRIDGHDMDAADAAIARAKVSTDRPHLIVCRTEIAHGSPNKAGTSKAHGSPLGVDEVRLAKERLRLPVDKEFWFPDEVAAFYRAAGPAGEELESAWNERMAEYRAAHPEVGATLERLIAGDFGAVKLTVPEGNMATRKASLLVLEQAAAQAPTLIGGAADLADSVFTTIEGGGTFQAETPSGRNIAFGVREHAMAAAVNGITLHGGCRAFGGTFLIFSDYCRPSLRLAALMECPSIFLFSHDSVGLGEDGPTHQPIEHLTALRAIPNFNVMRPADPAETAECWRIALESKHAPCALVLTRQNVLSVSPTQSEHPARMGAYVLREASAAPQVVLLATGSEVAPALRASELLEERGVPARVVSMPSMFLFEAQDRAYRERVLPKGVPTVSVEAGSPLCWGAYAQAHVAMRRFGASAPGNVLMEKFGFTPENIVEVALELLGEGSVPG